MAKNAVTDWSATDALNTDVGGTNIAEGCAPGGINDAIRKVMAQIAGFVTNAVFGGVTINGSTPTLNLNGGGGSNDGTILLYSGGTLKSTVRSSGGGALSASDTHSFKNLSEGVTYLTLNATAMNINPAATIGAGLSATGAIRATGSTTANTNLAPGVELSHDGSNGFVQSVDRSAGVTYKGLRLYGADIGILPQAAGNSISLVGHAGVSRILSVGSANLGGVSGQIQFGRADGAANLANISWQAGNEFRIANNNGGVISHTVNGAETFRTLTGGARFTHSEFPRLEFYRAGTGSWTIGGTGTPGDNSFCIRLNGGPAAFTIDSGNAVAVKAGLSAEGAILSNLSLRAGNSGVGAGSIRMAAGDGTRSGIVSFLDTAGSPTGSIQQTIGGPIVYDNASGGGHALTGGGATIYGNILLGQVAPTIQFNPGGPAIWAPAGNTLAFGTASTLYPRIWLDSGGFTNIHGDRGTSGSVPGSGSLRVIASGMNYAINTYHTTDYTAVQFVRDIGGSAVQIGEINVRASSIDYNNPSDARRKTGFRDFDSGDLIDRLRFGTFDWLPEYGGGTGYGVIAQDAHDVFPQAITPGDDETPWQADYSKFVAIAMAELRKLRARVAMLEARHG